MGTTKFWGEMVASDVIEEVHTNHVPLGPVFYLPYRPVIQESSSSRKIRPVFDASSKTENDTDLNDCHETGQSLNQN